MKIFEYERNHLGDKPKIKIESIEEKVKFLIYVLQRLKNMYLEGVDDVVQDQMDKGNIRSKNDLVYPNVPSQEYLKQQINHSSLALEKAADMATDEAQIIEQNRHVRLQMEEKNKDLEASST